MAVFHVVVVLFHCAGVGAASPVGPAASDIVALLHFDDREEAVGLLQLRASALGSGTALTASDEEASSFDARPQPVAVDFRSISRKARDPPPVAWPSPRNCSACRDLREPLMAFFQAAGGRGWNDVSGWGSTSNPCQWLGVMCDATHALIGLNLVQNNLQGDLTEALETLRPFYPSLNILMLGTNNFHGEIPDMIQDMQTLTYLGLWSAGLTGTIPVALGNLPRLTQLAIGWNKLTGAIPSELGKLKELEVLELFGQPVKGPIPESFGNLTRLSELAAFDTELGGTIPSSLGRLTNLMYLQLGNASLEGPIPNSFSRLSKMLEIGLHANDLTGTIPAGLGKWTELTYCLLANNRLEGMVPKSFGRMTKLGSLDLSQNKLTGFPPELFSHWPMITFLSLGSNNFSKATLPQNLDKLEDLHILNISGGNFSGSIPTTFGNLRNLQKLILSGNSLEGEIPDLALLLSATDIDLSGNVLNGTVPRLPKTGKLQTLNLSGNRMQKWSAGGVCDDGPAACDLSGNGLSCPVHAAGCAIRCGLKCPVASAYSNFVKVILDVLWYPFGIIFGFSEGHFVERPAD